MLYLFDICYISSYIRFLGKIIFMCPKKCKFSHEIRCFWSSCYFVDCKGNVRFCSHHPNPKGFLTPKKGSSCVLRSVS
jgi:hypothetical protein